MKKRNFAERLSKFYLRLGRGHSLVDFIITMVKNIVYLGLAMVLFQKFFGFLPPKWIAVVLGIMFEMTCYLIGYYDEKVGFWKFQNSYNSKELNPYGEELMERVRSIDEKLK